MSEIIRIDTNGVLFKAPIGAESYGTWLEAAYHSSGNKSVTGRPYYEGIGQKINAIICAANHKGAHVITSGLDGEECASVITKLSNGSVEPQIIQGDIL